jgi:hypothetical protein
MGKRMFHRIGVNFLIAQHGVFCVFNEPVSVDVIFSKYSFSSTEFANIVIS